MALSALLADMGDSAAAGVVFAPQASRIWISAAGCLEIPTLPASLQRRPQGSRDLVIERVRCAMELDPATLPIPQSFKCPITHEVRRLRANAVALYRPFYDFLKSFPEWTENTF